SAGVQDRDARIHEGILGLVRQSGGFAGVIIAGEQKDPAMSCGAGGVAVLKRVAAAVDTGALRVPQGEYAVVFGATKHIDLLGAPNRRRTKFLIDRRLEANMVSLEKAACAPQGLVKSTQGRATVTRDEAPCIQSSCDIALSLHHRQAHKCLGTGEVNPSL